MPLFHVLGRIFVLSQIARQTTEITVVAIDKRGKLEQGYSPFIFVRRCIKGNFYMRLMATHFPLFAVKKFLQDSSDFLV